MDLRCRFPPVMAGSVIGISMLLTFVVAGRGIGVSGMMTRLVATVQHWLLPELTEKSAYFGPYFAHGAHPLNDYLSYLMVGLLAGAFAGACVVLVISASKCSAGRAFRWRAGCSMHSSAAPLPVLPHAWRVAAPAARGWSAAPSFRWAPGRSCCVSSSAVSRRPGS